MIGLLRKLFRRADPLVKASRHASAEAFAEAIGAADVFVIAAMSGDGLDPATLTEAILLAEVERTARELSESAGFDLFVYTRDGETCLPFFSSQEHCQAFAGEYSKSRNRIYGFQVLEVKGSVVGARVENWDRVVLNDGSPDERVLSSTEKRLLQEASA